MPPFSRPPQHTPAPPPSGDAPPLPPLGPVRSRFGLDLRSLAAFRIALGILLVADALLRCRDFRLMFTPDGMFPHEALLAFQPSVGNWSLAFLVDAAWWDAVILALEGFAGLWLVVGLQTRLATVVAWVTLVSVVRRTAPATNAGDLWLITLLLWGVFLPLGARWSLDARRQGRAHAAPIHLSIASAALTLQVLVVYLAAGLAKCNGTWFSGHAVRDALSVHDHGTPLGAWLVGFPGVAAAAGIMVLALELAGPAVFLALPHPRIRAAIAASFILFHALVALLMTVGLFAPIGIAAWLALLPSAAWEALGTLAKPAHANTAEPSHDVPDAARSLPTTGRRAAASIAVQLACGCLLVLAVTDATARLLTQTIQLPGRLQAAIDIACLRQDWEMFGTVPQQEQWGYARGVLADGDEVDLLRGGRPLERERPSGGFTTLPHHRWHKILWELPKPPMRVFSPSIARALATDWNRHHGPEEQVQRLEICFTRLTATTASSQTEPGVRHELIVASWPPRDARGSGNLDRFLEEHGEGH